MNSAALDSKLACAWRALPPTTPFTQPQDNPSEPLQAKQRATTKAMGEPAHIAHTRDALKCEALRRLKPQAARNGHQYAGTICSQNDSKVSLHLRLRTRTEPEDL